MYLKEKTFPFVKDNQVHESGNEEYPKWHGLQGQQEVGVHPC